MSYIKAVRCGDLVEVYTFEHEPLRRRRVTNRRKARTASRSLRRGSNIVRAKRSFIRLVRANSKTESPPVFLTLTMRSIVDLSVANKSYRLFLQRFRARYGKDTVRVISVPEFQKRGAVHYHCLVWGLPFRIGARGSPVAEERATREIATLWGHGFVDAVWTDGSPALAGYMAKYMTKTLSDFRLAGKRAYSSSRNVLRPSVLTSSMPVALDFMLEEWGITGVIPTAHLLNEKQFETMWLGRGKYQSYNLFADHE